MFDFWKNIFRGFGGKLAHHPEARRLVWLLIVVAFFSACCVFFAAYVSYSRYLDLMGFIAGAEIVAMCFTVGIALYMFFGSSHVATFIAEKWLKGSSSLAWQFTVLVSVSLIVFGTIDYNMNMDGAQDVAVKAAGTVEKVNESGINKIYGDQIQTEQDKLNELLAGKLGGYGWKDPKTHIYHLNSSGKKFQRSLSANIDKLRSQQAKALDNDRTRFTNDADEWAQRKKTTHSRLITAVRSVYFLQFVLCMVMAFIGVKMSEAIEEDFEYGPGMTPDQFGTMLKSIKDDIQPAGYTAKSGYKDSDIGFKAKSKSMEKWEADLEKFQAEIMEIMKSIERKQGSQNRKANERRVPKGRQFSEAYQPSRKGPKRNGKRVEGIESRNAILSAYKALKSAGEKPTHKAISEVTGISQRTVGSHVREMKREGLL